MSERSLQDLLSELAQLALPEEDPAKVTESNRRILMALEEEGLIEAEAPPDSVGLRGRRNAMRPSLRWSAGLVVIVLALTVVVSSSGPALARWIEDAVGSLGGRLWPTLDGGNLTQHRDPDATAATAKSNAGVVIGAESRSGLHLELTQSRSASGDDCFGVEIPATGDRVASCPHFSILVRNRPRPVRGPVVDQHALDMPGLGGRSILAGRTPIGTASLWIYPTAADGPGHEPVQALVADPRPRLAQTSDNQEPNRYFAAVLPPGVESALLIAFGADGAPIASRHFSADLPDTSSGEIVPADKVKP